MIRIPFINRRPVPVTDSRSARAKAQPRDEKGRFVALDANRSIRSQTKIVNKVGGKAGESHGRSGSVCLYKGREPTRSELNFRKSFGGSGDLIVVDESNAFSGGPRRNLTVVSTRVKDRKEFLKMGRLVRDRKGNLRKYAGSRYEDVLPIIEGLSQQNIVVVESHEPIIKAKDAGSRKAAYIRNLKSSVNAAIDIDPSRQTDILIDSLPVDAKNEVLQYGRALTAVGKNVGWFETGSSNGSAELQINDFIVGTVGDKIEGVEKGRRLFEKHLFKVFKRRDEP